MTDSSAIWNARQIKAPEEWRHFKRQSRLTGLSWRMDN
jgi:hypothetical protein